MKEVLTGLHEGPLGGHLGVEKTLARVQKCFYWPGYHDDVRNRCRCCAVCAYTIQTLPLVNHFERNITC